MKKLKQTKTQIAKLLKTWDNETLYTTRNSYRRRAKEYQKQERDYFFYKMIESIELIDAEIDSRRDINGVFTVKNLELCN